MLKRLNPNGNNNTFWKQKSYFFKGIVRPYKLKYWYWEFCVIFRRLCIILFITLQYFDKLVMHILLIILLIIFCIIEYFCNPFKYKRAFILDLICSICIIICLIIIICNIDNNFYYSQQIINDKNNIEIGNTNNISISEMGSNQIATIISISIIIIIIPILLLLWYISCSIWSCCTKNENNSNDILNKRYESMRRRLSIEDDKPNSPLAIDDGYIKVTRKETNSNESEPELNRDPTLNRILETAEYTQEYTETTHNNNNNSKDKSVSTKIKKINNKKYQRIYPDKSEDNDDDDDDDDDDIDGSFTISNTYSAHTNNELVSPNIELISSKMPFSKSKLKAIEETQASESKESKESNSSFVRKRQNNKQIGLIITSDAKSRTIQSSGYDGTFSSVHGFGVTDMGRHNKQSLIIKDNNNNNIDIDITESDSHFTFTKTTNDDDERIETESEIINKNDDEIKHVSDDEEEEDDDDDDDIGLLDPSKEYTTRSQTEQQKVIIPGTNNNNIEQKMDEILNTQRQTQKQSESQTRLSYTSSKKELTPPSSVKHTNSGNDDDTSGSDDHDDKLEELVHEILSTPNIDNNNNKNGSVSKPLLAPDHATDTEDDHDHDINDKDIDINGIKKIIITQEKEFENNNNIFEGQKDVSISSDDKVTHGINFKTTPLQHSRNKSDSIMSVMSESKIEFTAAKSIGYSNQSAIKLKNESEWQNEFIAHSQEVEPKNKKKKADKLLKTATPKDIAIGFSKSRSITSTLETVNENNNDNINKKSFVRESNLNAPIVRGNIMSPSMDNQRFARQHSITSIGSKQSNINQKNKINTNTKKEESKSESDSSDSSSESESYSSTSISMDSQFERKSWNEYENHLRKLFNLWTETNGKYMTLNELKRFLDIIEITKWWTMEQVLKVMRKNDNNKIKLNEFISYFCNKEMNIKAIQLKKHIEKQISWTLLLKTLDIFDKLDINNNGHLDKNEFKEFGKMLKLSQNETNILWNKIDINNTQKITIIQLFEWFKKRLEDVKKKKKRKKNTATSEWSRSHSSFDDESEDTQSIQTETNDSNQQY